MMADPPARPELSADELAQWNELVEERCGTHFTASRAHYLRNCLWERMRTLGLATYAGYYKAITDGASGQTEWLALLERLLNRQTSFFRHTPSYTALQNIVLPQLLEERRHGSAAIDLWSAGCSTGEEPYSLAMSALEATGARKDVAVRVLASDISETALERARRGVYTTRAAASIPLAIRKRYMTLIEEERDVHYEIGPAVRSLVRFDSFNLIQPGTYPAGQRDVIFCHNVLIYLKDAKKMRIVEQLGQKLNRGGFLFLAPGEMIGQKFPGLQAVKFESSLVYRREQ